MNLHSSIATNAEKSEALQAEVEAWLDEGNHITQMSPVGADQHADHDKYRASVRSLVHAAMKAGWTQKQIAERIGLPTDAVSRVHRTTGLVSMVHLKKLENGLLKMELI